MIVYLHDYMQSTLFKEYFFSRPYTHDKSNVTAVFLKLTLPQDFSCRCYRYRSILGRYRSNRVIHITFKHI